MEKQLSIPSTLVTQDQEFLLENNVTSLRDLDEALPAPAMGLPYLYLPVGSKRQPVPAPNPATATERLPGVEKW
eukprot:scaffold5864_cov93-Skeletonema_dohrnii-CCMP3373.AAC.6